MFASKPDLKARWAPRDLMLIRLASWLLSRKWWCRHSFIALPHPNEYFLLHALSWVPATTIDLAVLQSRSQSLIIPVLLKHLHLPRCRDMRISPLWSHFHLQRTCHLGSWGLSRKWNTEVSSAAACPLTSIPFEQAAPQQTSHSCQSDHCLLSNYSLPHHHQEEESQALQHFTQNLVSFYLSTTSAHVLSHKGLDWIESSGLPNYFHNGRDCHPLHLSPLLFFHLFLTNWSGENQFSFTTQLKHPMIRRLLPLLHTQMELVWKPHEFSGSK